MSRSPLSPHFHMHELCPDAVLYKVALRPFKTFCLHPKISVSALDPTHPGTNFDCVENFSFTVKALTAFW